MAVIAPTGNIYQTLLNYVAEIRFTRRVRVRGLPPIRRMICTNNIALLDSPNGKIVLNYRKPTHGLRYDPAKHGLVVTWDILMQDYRNVSLDNCQVLQVWEPNDQFWKHFNEKIYVMSQQQKINFMAS